eukprot:5860617-Pyramimonas_sp.AAC.1
MRLYAIELHWEARFWVWCPHRGPWKAMLGVANKATTAAAATAAAAEDLVALAGLHVPIDDRPDP